jgi:hypothetical protein
MGQLRLRMIKWKMVFLKTKNNKKSVGRIMDPVGEMGKPSAMTS